MSALFLALAFPLTLVAALMVLRAPGLPTEIGCARVRCPAAGRSAWVVAYECDTALPAGPGPRRVCVASCSLRAAAASCDAACLEHAHGSLRA